MKDEIYKTCLRDLIPLIAEDALEAKEDSRKYPTDFNKGRMMGYFEVLSTVKNQINPFNIGEKDIGLDKINIDEYL
ncbi:hypothetical protein KJ742_02310 [Patescibacteria group bacterium]|nr:hypothetical protein [Patescibacteria group bacterium]MBU1682754.1 hypothetical protein [Patescibacteria group bacterium]